MSSKQRDRFHFSTLFWAPKTSERKSQFHSFSATLLICEQRQQQASQGHWCMKEDQEHRDLFFSLGILQHHSVTTTKFAFIATAKKFWAAPKPAHWNWYKLWQRHYLWKYQLEMAPGFPHVRGGVGSWRPHIWLFWAWSNGQIMEHGIKFLLVPLPMHMEQWISGSVVLGFPLAVFCPRTLLGFCVQGSPWCLSAEAPRQVWRASCQLLPSCFPGFRKAKENSNLCIKILHCQTEQ